MTCSLSKKTLESKSTLKCASSHSANGAVGVLQDRMLHLRNDDNIGIFRGAAHRKA